MENITAAPLTEADMLRHEANIVASYPMKEDTVPHKLERFDSAYIHLRRGHKSKHFKAVDMSEAKQLAKAQTYFSDLAQHAEGDAKTALGLMAASLGAQTKIAAEKGNKGKIVLDLNLLEREDREDELRSKQDTDKIATIRAQMGMSKDFQTAMNELAAKN